MSPYKAFLNNTRQYFNTRGFFRFLLSGYLFIFALGGLIYLLGGFILAIYEPFCIIGSILMYTGLLLTVLREDLMGLVITSATISVGSLIAWIIALAGARAYGYYQVGGMFLFGPLFYFLSFGLIAVLVFVMAEKFKQMRAASAIARAQTAGISCPKCGAFVPMTAMFCPSCGVKNPGIQQYGAVQQPQVTPPQAAPKCSNCGADIFPGNAFCARCGAKQ